VVRRRYRPLLPTKAILGAIWHQELRSQFRAACGVTRLHIMAGVQNKNVYEIIIATDENEVAGR